MKLPAILACLLLAGCTHNASSLKKSDAKVDQNTAQLTEESRALTTGALDALNYAPTNPPTTLAKTFLKKDQQIEGLPLQRLDVEAILRGQTRAMDERLAKIDVLLDDRQKLVAENDALKAKLVEMGKLYEAEHNKGILKRVFGWLGFGGSIAAIIALFIFFPPSLAIAGHLLAWIVGKLPGLASWIGVVSTKAFDSVVKGVEQAKSKLGDNTPALETTLSQTMDSDHKRLVRARKVSIKT